MGRNIKALPSLTFFSAWVSIIALEFVVPIKENKK